MVLHASGLPVLSLHHQSWRGSIVVMQVHKNRPLKRAGVAGKALRASVLLRIYFRSLSASLCRAGSRGCRWVVRGCLRACRASEAVRRGGKKKPPGGGGNQSLSVSRV
ncbi:hypothetical protein DWA36_20495 [Klebsiella pneumoniae]|nr:hypothetical protein DWA36_20495 [Klebsiella pneumoniae]